MKFEWDKKYTTIAIYSILVIIISSIAVLFVSNFKAATASISWFFGILSPFLGGAVIAYMLNPIVMMLENTFLRRIPKRKTRRAVSMFLTYSFAFILITVLIMNIIPQLQESITGLISNSKLYIDNVNNYFLELAEDNPWLREPFDSAADYIEEFIKNSGTIIREVVPTVMSITTSVSNILIAVVASIYLLSEKEKMLSQSRRIVFALFDKKAADGILELSSFANNCFSKFISGQIYVSLITGTVTFIVGTMMKVPFPLIMAFIIAITNIIPLFGPIIGSILCIFITLLINPTLALWFGIFIIILQQIDSNIISPRIIGNSIGLSPFWVMFAVIVFGALFGFSGLVFGVPLFTVIYATTRYVITEKLTKRGMNATDSRYYEKYVVENNRFKIPSSKEKQEFSFNIVKKLIRKKDDKTQPKE